MRMLVGGIDSSGPAVSGRVGDEDPLQAVADALVEFPADALILGVHPSDDANWRERRFSKKVRERFAWGSETRFALGEQARHGHR
jgi:hypothetical protein